MDPKTSKQLIGLGALALAVLLTVAVAADGAGRMMPYAEAAKLRALRDELTVLAKKRRVHPDTFVSSTGPTVYELGRIDDPYKLDVFRGDMLAAAARLRSGRFAIVDATIVPAR